MSIFIEYIIIDNMVMDYIILRLMELTVGIKFGRSRKLLVCFFGACFALLMPLIMQYKILLFLYRILTSIIMVLCIKKYKNLKSFFVYELMFFAYTFFVGGVCLGLIQLMGIDYTMSSVVMYEFDFPFGVFGVVLVITLKVMSKVVGVVKSKLNTSNFIRKIKLIEGDKSISSYAFIDTGNKIKYNGNSVSIISIGVFMQLFKDIDISKLLCGSIDENKLKEVEYIDIGGLGATNKYLSFVLDFIEIDGRMYKSPRFALSWKNLGEFEIILHSEFVGGGYEKINSKT